MSKVDELEQSIEAIAGEQTPRKEPPTNNQPNTGQQIPPTEINNNSSTAEFFSGEQKTEKKDNEKSIQESGEAGAYLASGAIETVFSLLERIVYLNKFSGEEKEKIIELQEKDENEYTDVEKKLNRRFLAVTKRHDKIRERIPLSDKDEQALKVAFTQYTRVTGKSLNPQLIVWSAIAKIFVSRSIDIFLD